MADTTKSHGSRLVCRVRELFQQQNYAAVCRMQGEIDKWQCAPKLQRTYAEVVFFLASALSMENAHDKAIHYYKIAYSLHTSFVRCAQADPGATRDDITAAERKLKTSTIKVELRQTIALGPCPCGSYPNQDQAK